MLTAYDTGHVTSATICAAFAEGCGGSISPIGPIVDPRQDGFVYGKLRGTLDVIERLRRYGRHLYYADNGYFGASDHAHGKFDGFYKVTRNAFQCDGDGSPDFDRLSHHSIELKPWQSNGRDILICPPIPDYCRVMKFDGDVWLADIVDKIRAVSDRPIRIRYRAGDPRASRKVSLAEELTSAHALITHDSNVVVEATIAGVPCFVTGTSPVLALCNRDLAEIENPYLDEDRRHWLAVLAANQWTLDEMRDGTCWKHLRDIYDE